MDTTTMEKIGKIAFQNCRGGGARSGAGRLIGLCTNWRPRQVTGSHKAKIHKDFTDAFAHLKAGFPKYPPSLDIYQDSSSIEVVPKTPSKARNMRFLG